jgi:release factor H-coupled RctB family protein
MWSSTLTLIAVSYVIGDPLTSETNALAQLQNAAELPGVVAAIGMPELHAGKGIPIGAVVITTEDCAYPQLVDNDIGCGMSFVETALMGGKWNRNKLSSMSKGLDSIIDNMRKRKKCVRNRPSGDRTN